MKKNRSNRWTTGITVKLENSDERLVLFELDREHLPFKQEVIDMYHSYKLDLLIHSTGSGGIHFISPTMVDKHTWKGFHTNLKHINTKCPMTTLRWLPNKYANESEKWYRHEAWYFSESVDSNNNEYLCNLLNLTFGTSFIGGNQINLVYVRYPLPKI